MHETHGEQGLLNYQTRLKNEGVAPDKLTALTHLPDVNWKALWDAVVEYGPEVVDVFVKVFGKPQPPVESGT